MYTVNVHIEGYTMNSYKWVEKLRDETGIKSDNSIAVLLGISRQCICDHKKGRNTTFDDKTCLKIAEILNIRPEEIIADQHMEGAKSPEEKQVWSNFLKLAGSAAAMLTGVALALPWAILNAPVCILC